MKSLKISLTVFYRFTAHSLRSLLSILMLICISGPSMACSMYKITEAGHTMVGCNHDTWLLTPRIWFETNGYGAGFTGARYDGSNGFAPQSGMNEFGLAFSRLAAATPANGTVAPGKKKIASQTLFLKEILHNYKTVEEVKAFVDQYDHSLFIQDILIYVDKSGKYLIVEPYTTISGNDAQYVQSNFCPSQVTDFSSIKQARYTKGIAFLKNKPARADLDFCRALSDTMHVCRDKIGDGTLLTSIWDAHQLDICLYFYHDYKHQVKFNLKEELSKGDHALEIPSLFPPNKEFKMLTDFKTPVTSNTVDTFLKVCFGFFLFSAIFFLISYFRKSAATHYRYLKLLLFPISLMMTYYAFVLGTKVDVFYFPAPYKDYKFTHLNVAAYIPFILLVLIVPLVVVNIKIFRQGAWLFPSKWLFAMNNIAYIVLIVLFAYWGLYDVFPAR